MTYILSMLSFSFSVCGKNRIDQHSPKISNFSVFLCVSQRIVCLFAWNKTMKDMNVAAQNNISDLLKLARKFNCFYLAGMSTLAFPYFC